MIDVTIQRDRVAAVQAAGDWFMANTLGAVLGRVINGTFVLNFSDSEEAAAFRAVWLVVTITLG